MSNEGMAHTLRDGTAHHKYDDHKKAFWYILHHTHGNPLDLIARDPSEASFYSLPLGMKADSTDVDIGVYHNAV